MTEAKRQPLAIEETEFQQFIAASIGKTLPMYGYSMFDGVPSTFAPVDHIPVTPDYVVGPGDEIVIRAWGQVDIDFRATIDRLGQIYIPKVGSLNVAGLKYQDLQGYIKTAIGRNFRNFELEVNLGQLRSVQIYVVGQARRPGSYTVSSLSTLVNALFASGGPSTKGSMRHIQLKRQDRVVTEFDVYDFLLKGDKSKDMPLQSGDVIYIPPIGPQVAISGSVNVPAVYELQENSTFSDLIALAGGLSNVAAMQKASVEQILDRKLRKVDEIQFDKDGLARKMQDGDVVKIYPISQRFDNAVKLQGHVASPIRMVWHKGIRVTDLLGGKDGLIPGAYWDRQNGGVLSGRYSRQEVNWDYAVIQRLNEDNLTTKLFAFNLGKAIQGDMGENVLLQPGDIVNIYSADESLPKTENDVALNGSIFTPSKKRFVWHKGMRIRDMIPNAQWLIDYYDYWLSWNGKNLNSGINWEYANVVRLQPNDLSRTMLTFDLGKAVLENDSANDIELSPGDEVSIFTNDEIQIPTAKTVRHVRMEGEFNHAGIYEARPGETLRQLVARMGGVTGNAYLFGAEFTRESTRQLQQQRLDQAISRMEQDMQKSAAASAGGAINPEDVTAVKLQIENQKAMLEKMKALRATGRIVLEISPDSSSIKDIPDIALEDGDRFYVPSMPSTVGVFGEVYSENGAFIYKSGKRVSDYLAQAGGPTRDADSDRTFVLRADGSVVNKEGRRGLFSSSFGGMELMPGDTVVVPQQLDKYSFMRGLRDWTSIISQFALGAAAIKVLKL
ncbi:MAG: SLBB domain-containing protein [Burkholderiales bacterium]|nr:SLBB domain-containing protein [Burkholderiales bacterium]